MPATSASRRLGLDDNFFDLGGDSILTAVVQRIHRANRAGLRLKPRSSFKHQTIAELARVAGTPWDWREPGQHRQPSGATGVPPPTHRQRPCGSGAGHAGKLRAFGREALEPGRPDGRGRGRHDRGAARGEPAWPADAQPRRDSPIRRRSAPGDESPARPADRTRDRDSALVDGDNGPGQWVGVMAMELAIRKARENGVGMVGARRSNHFGAAGHYAWLGARQRPDRPAARRTALVAGATGGVTPTFGTNPLAVGIPAARIPSDPPRHLDERRGEGQGWRCISRRKTVRRRLDPRPVRESLSTDARTWPQASECRSGATRATASRS